MRVIPFSPGPSLDPGIVLRSSKRDSTESFTGALSSKLQEINAMQNQSDKAMAEGSIQGANSIHETMIQVEEADISLRLLTRVRNKALEAYQEVMRMQF